MGSASNYSLNNLSESLILEACVDTVEDAIQAEKNGAHQIEWCANLEQDGLTPDKGKTIQLLEIIKIPVKVMIRCRPGNFIYNHEECTVMEKDASYFSSLPGVAGLVFGATTMDRTLDLDAIQRIVSAANGLPLSIHKAIDTCENLCKESQRLNDISGVSFLLSSGGAATAWDGKEMLKLMQEKFNGKVIAAGKIKWDNVSTLHRVLAFQYYHGKQIVK